MNKNGILPAWRVKHHAGRILQLSLFGIPMGLVPGGAAHAYQCADNGGLRSCEKPLELLWHAQDRPVGPYYTDLADAVTTESARLMADHCPLCTDVYAVPSAPPLVCQNPHGANNGEACFPLIYYHLPPGTVYSPSLAANENYPVWLSVYHTMGSPPATKWVLNASTTDLNPNPAILESKISCPYGLTPFLDVGDTSPSSLDPRYWMCAAPTEPVASVSGLDATEDGAACGCNPVDLATGAKIDVQTDYRNASPYPIVWERTYHSARGEWTFSYERSIQFHADSTTERVKMLRPDGTVLRFKRPVGGPALWSLDMPENPTVLGTLTSAYAMLGAPSGFEYRNLRDEVEAYDPEGRLTQIADKTGRTLDFAYGSSGLLETVSDNAGRTLTVTHTAADANGRRSVASITDGALTVSYVSVAAVEILDNGSELPRRFLTEVHASDGTAVRYTYDNNDGSGKGLLTGIEDQDAVAWGHYTYDGNKRVLTTAHGSAGTQDVLTYAYPTGSTRVSWDGDVTWPSQFSRAPVAAGVPKTAGSDHPCAFCFGSGTGAASATYDAAGNPIAVSDFDGRQTRRTYDTTRGLVTSETQAYGTSQARTVTTMWNSTWRVPDSRTEPMEVGNGSGSTTAGTLTTAWTYDTQGNPLTEIRTPSNGEAPRKRRWTWNAQGQMLTAKDSRGNTTTYDYDGQFNWVSVTNDLGHTTVLSDHTAQGLPGRLTDPNGLETRITYDNAQRPILIRRGNPGAGWRDTAFTYTPVGLLERVDRADGSWAQFVYDDAHRLTEIRTALGKRVRTLDPLGRVVLAQTFDAANVLIERGGAAYDELSRLESTWNAANDTTHYTYTANGQLESVVHPDFHSRTTSYDHLGRTLGFWDENLAYGQTLHTPQDALKEVDDDRWNGTYFNRNAYGNLSFLESWDTGITSHTWNPNDFPVTSTDARGAAATRTYDPLDRVTQLVFAGPGLVGETQTFVYDACSNGIGRLCTMTDASGTTDYTYSIWGDVLTRTFTPLALPSITLTTAYGYDASGRLVSIAYPSGKILTRAFAQDRVTGLTWDGTSVLSGATERPFAGGTLGWTWGAGLGPVSYRYDLDGRVSEIADTDTRTYVRDSRNRITGIADGSDPLKSQTYVYDPTNRLWTFTRGSGPAPFEFRYDSVGNRSGDAVMASPVSSGNTYDYFPGNRLYSLTPDSSPPQLWSYDAAGNLLNDANGLTLTYGANGRMLGSAKGSATAIYAYNGFGQRAYKAVTTGSGTTQEVWIHDEAGRLMGRYSAAGVPLEELVYLDGFRPVATVRSSGIHRMLTDHLGTPRKVLDPSGTTVWAWDAKEAFGFEAPVSGSGFEFNLRFPGQYADGETGLFHNGFRDYHPRAGRYVQSDPIGLAGGINTYGYAGANSVGNTDALGLKFGESFNHPSVREALSYLSRSPTAAKLLARAQEDDRVLEVALISFDVRALNTDPRSIAAGFDQDRKIVWDNKIGIMCLETGSVLSPAMILFHEFVHFVQSSDRERYLKLRRTTGDLSSPFGSEAEKEDILVYENTVAKELGQELVRDSHRRPLNAGPEWQNRSFIKYPVHPGGRYYGD